MSSRVQYTRTGISDMGRMAQEGEAQRMANQQMTAEARKLLYREKERQRQEAEDSDCSTNGQLNLRTSLKNEPPSLSRFSSRHSSIEPSSYVSSTSLEPRELRRQIILLEEKLKEVMLNNGQLDCDKQYLSYSHELLQDKLEDLSESNAYNQKCLTERKKDLAYQRMQIAELTHQLEFARAQIEVRDELIAERGLILVNATDMDSDISEKERANHECGFAEGRKKLVLANGKDILEQSNLLVNGEVDDTAISRKSSSSYAILSKSIADALKSVNGSGIEDKLASLLLERTKSQEQIDTLKLHLAEEQERVEMLQRIESRVKGGDPETLRQNVQTARSQAQDYKFRLEQATQKITGLEGEIIRLESQVKRYKIIADSCEQQEESLKADRRKSQREVREAQTTIEDLKSENSMLQRKIDKLSRGIPNSTSSIFRDSSQAR